MAELKIDEKDKVRMMKTKAAALVMALVAALEKD